MTILARHAQSMDTATLKDVVSCMQSEIERRTAKGCSGKWVANATARFEVYSQELAERK